jgi:putative lipoprotein
MTNRFYKASSPLKVYRGKYGYALLAVLLGINSGCANFRSCGQDDPWLGPDKVKHFTAAALIGGGATALAATETDTGEAAAIGWTVAVGAGLAKEHYDLRVKKTCFSWKDLAWDVIGASVGVSIAAWAAE